jgi:hypothetical protein
MKNKIRAKNYKRTKTRLKDKKMTDKEIEKELNKILDRCNELQK